MHQIGPSLQQVLPKGEVKAREFPTYMGLYLKLL